MAWDLARGPTLDRLLERERQGREVPELLDRPALGPRTQWTMDAFERLSTERMSGFSHGPIPHSAVVREALRLGLDEDGLHELWTAIDKLDRQWRAVANAPQPSPGGQGGGLSDQDHGRPVRRGSRKPRSDT